MRNFWLFRKSPDHLSPEKKRAFWAWNVFILFCAGVCLGGLSMFFAYGDYTDMLMKSYFTVPLIPILNIVPVILLVFAMWFLLGRPWLAFLISVASFLYLHFSLYASGCAIISFATATSSSISCVEKSSISIRLRIN